jgi:hypothetical protein
VSPSRVVTVAAIVCAPAAIAVALVGAWLSSQTPAAPQLITACFFIAGVLVIAWVGAVIVVWRRVTRARGEGVKEPIPRATIVDHRSRH